MNINHKAGHLWNGLAFDVLSAPPIHRIILTGMTLLAIMVIVKEGLSVVALGVIAALVVSALSLVMRPPVHAITGAPGPQGPMGLTGAAGQDLHRDLYQRGLTSLSYENWLIQEFHPMLVHFRKQTFTHDEVEILTKAFDDYMTMPDIPSQFRHATFKAFLTHYDTSIVIRGCVAKYFDSRVKADDAVEKVKVLMA